MRVCSSRIVHAHLDPLGAEQRGQLVARLVTHRKDVIDTRRSWALRQRDQIGREALAQARSVASACRVPRLEIWQLDAQKRRLQPVQSLVVAHDRVLPLRALTEIAQLPDAIRELL